MIMPTMIRISGKKRISSIPGMIRKWGKIKSSRITKSNAPIRRLPAIRMIPAMSRRRGTVMPNDQWTRLLKKWLIPEMKSPNPGRWISQPLLLMIHKIPTIMRT